MTKKKFNPLGFCRYAEDCLVSSEEVGKDLTPISCIKCLLGSLDFDKLDVEAIKQNVNGALKILNEMELHGMESAKIKFYCSKHDHFSIEDYCKYCENEEKENIKRT